MDEAKLELKLTDIYNRLFKTYGPQHWWPAETPFEVIVGAILTQSAAWTNVEKAINNLKNDNVLSPAALRKIPETELARLIYSSGYYNAKARKLKAFTEWFGREHGDSLENLFTLDVTNVRKQLLSVHGIGEETADSIILYAGNKPIFVIDAYTRRIFSRLGMAPTAGIYHDYQKLFMDAFLHNASPGAAALFNEYHALLVKLGKEVCHNNKPDCLNCCLNIAVNKKSHNRSGSFPCNSTHH
jgi:endonuclease III related protein